MKTNYTTTTPHVILTLNAVKGKDLMGYGSMMRSFAMLRMTCVILLLAACQQEDHTAPATGQEITIHIPEYPADAEATARTRAAANWQTGDLLYIVLQCYDVPVGGNIIQRTYHIARYTGGEWQMDKPLTVHPAAVRFDIIAYHTDGAAVGEAITGDLLYSETGRLADETTVTLNPFDHWYARITFTGLTEGNEITLGSGWEHLKLDDTYLLVDAGAPATLTADADEKAVVYTDISGAVTCQFTIDGKTFNFTPTGDYWNRAYTIDCKTLLNTGSITPGQMEEEEKAERPAERERFIAWANGTATENWTNSDFTLKYDIDLTGVSFAPIGTDFSHTFDGDGHTITGLKVETGAQNVGMFFTTTSSATVKNLHLRGASIKNTTSEGFVGGIIGESHGTITNCTVQGEVEGAYAGGIVGYNNGTLTGCGVSGTVNSAGGQAGGIASFNALIINQCYSVAKVTGNAAGGIAAFNAYTGTITQCYWYSNNGAEDAVATNFNSAATTDATPYDTVEETIDAWKANQ